MNNSKTETKIEIIRSKPKELSGKVVEVSKTTQTNGNYTEISWETVCKDEPAKGEG